MAHPRTRSMVASSKAAVTGSPADILDAMLANQAAAARAIAENPEPDEPEITIPADEDEDGDTGEQQHDDALTEREQITADHFESWSVDHEYRGGDE